MKDNPYLRLARILYPLAVYLAVYNMTFYLLGRLDGLTALMRLLIAGLAALVPTGIIYLKRNRSRRRQDDRQDDIRPLRIIGLAVLTILLGLGLNLLAAKLPLDELSQAYAEASAILYDGPLPLQILSNVIVIPLLEETLYRGIIAEEIDAWLTRRAAVLISALIFGLAHMNMVQFVYASVIGLCLGELYLSSHRLWVSWAVHGLLNLIVIAGAA